MKKHPKSLRSLITLWFLTFSLVPLAFVSGYSTVLYESSINTELEKRLESNLHEVAVTLYQLEAFLKKGGKVHANDPTLIFHTATHNIPACRRVVGDWMRTYSASRMALFDRDGRLIVSQYRDPSGIVHAQPQLETGNVFLSDDLKAQIDKERQVVIREVQKNRGLNLIVYTSVKRKDGGVAGSLEETIELGPSFLEDMLKKRLNLEAVIFDDQGQPALATQKDFMYYPPGFFSSHIQGTHAFVDLVSRGEPFGMIIRKIVDTSGKPIVTLGLAASKKDSRQVLRRIKITLLIMTALILLVMFPGLVYVSNRVVMPIHALVDATRKLEAGETGYRLDLVNDTEIGILIDSFNRMSESIASSQARLIHSAKMISLGQLVAGVAHELNNPIGFIFSNTGHLRDYVERLKRVIEVAETDPKRVAAIKKEVDFDFIIEDLPKLISSCEDGARRTRDIVLGLRQFSRLDEAQLKPLDVHQALRNTVHLLSGELKNRVQVSEDFKLDREVRCYASQINQVFMNIIGNAAQAISGKGQIFIKTWRSGRDAFISIKDSGAGIAKEDLERIFDPFFTTKPVGTGTGLGLSISYGIIQKHKGDITVESQPSKGTEFLIRLPVDGPPPDSSAEAKATV